MGDRNEIKPKSEQLGHVTSMRKNAEVAVFKLVESAHTTCLKQNSFTKIDI